MTVQRRDDRLDVVDLSAVGGWHAELTGDDPQAIVVSFVRPRARVEVAIHLTATGISSSVSSTTG